MGKYDSTKTRVSPVFAQLGRRKNLDWLAELLALPQREGVTAARSVTPPLVAPIRHGKTEARIPPPIELLRFMIRNPDRLRRPSSLGRSPRTREKREALLSKHLRKPVQDEALALLAKRAPLRDWYVLEGPTQPDVCIETADALIVIEGKRTERDATRVTTWLDKRDQMLRHLDGAWEQRRGRRLYGFLIVENVGGVEVPAHWRDVCEHTVSSQTLKDSLPHRSVAERAAIATSFLGATTWQRVCQVLGVEGIL